MTHRRRCSQVCHFLRFTASSRVGWVRERRSTACSGNSAVVLKAANETRTFRHEHYFGSNRRSVTLYAGKIKLEMFAPQFYNPNSGSRDEVINCSFILKQSQEDNPYLRYKMTMV